jgi:hypothetical protein
LPTLRFVAVRRRTRRLLLDEHPVQLPEIAVIKKPADYVCRDLACALLVKPVRGQAGGPVLSPPVQGLKRPSSRLIRSTLAVILEGAKMMIGLYRSVGVVATIAGYGLALLAATILSAQAIAWLNDGYCTGLDLRLAWKFLGFTEAPLPWYGVEKIRTAILDMPLVGGVFAGATVIYVAGMFSMVAAELESDKRKG